MPFEARTMAEQRLSLVGEIMTGELSISALCRKYNISRPTAYRWLRRSEAGVDLEDMSRAPVHRPSQTPAYVEKQVIDQRLKHPCWGARKLKASLERQFGVPFPSPSTIQAILHRHGLVSPEASRAATPYKRFEMEAPNDLWQTDFKGHFEMLDGNRCHPLTVTDDHSRYSLCVSAKANERLDGVAESFLLLFQEYGLPAAVLCDNGNPWGDWGGYTRFEIFLMNYGVLPIHGRPFRPQTQGKAERFHRTLKQEVLATERIKDLLAAQAKFDAFRKIYNEVRPHGALGNDVPADRYKHSKRIMPQRIREWEYPQGTEVRSIAAHDLKYKGSRIYLSEAFEGCKVALIESSKDGIIDVVYRNFIVAKISLREKRLISKKIVRMQKHA